MKTDAGGREFKSDILEIPEATGWPADRFRDKDFGKGDTGPREKEGEKR
ncbi:MAG: hypothetical protein ACYTFG_19515 [Planctomycetota bacterium]|jgi:hypothetical protein